MYTKSGPEVGFFLLNVRFEVEMQSKPFPLPNFFSRFLPNGGTFK